jgi:hypothetical protein
MGDYLGRVIYNEDPTFSGRCKVRVFGLFDDLSENNIPWFTPISSNVFSSDGAGSISVPKIGDIVRVRFSNNDYYSGEYMAIQNIDPNLVERIKDDYLGTHVLLYDSSKDLVVMYQPKMGYKMALNGSVIKIDADGMIQIQHKNNANVIEITNDAIKIISGNDSPINITTNGNLDVKAGTVNVNSENIRLGSGSAQFKAVKGDMLVNALKAICMELPTKYPPVSANSTRNFEEILSDQVKLS